MPARDRQPDRSALTSCNVGGKTEYQQARQTVAAYHENCLHELVEHVADALDRYRADEIDAFALDETIHHYHRAARELWKFCWAGSGGTQLQMTARFIDEEASSTRVTDWWERGTPRRAVESSSATSDGIPPAYAREVETQPGTLGSHDQPHCIAGRTALYCR
jgi:hypothetical protein